MTAFSADYPWLPKEPAIGDLGERFGNFGESARPERDRPTTCQLAICEFASIPCLLFDHCDHMLRG